MAKKIDGLIVEKYLWKDLTTLLAVYNEDNTLKTRYSYANSRVPYKMTHNNTTYYLLYNHLGSLRAVSDNSGNIVKEITYDSFGTILSDTNSSLHVNLGFAGGLYDTDTKLTRFGYRDYDAETGKWTAKDPIGFNGGDTNLYGYVVNDPVNFIDPKGLSGLGLPWNKPKFQYGLPQGTMNTNIPAKWYTNPPRVPSNWVAKPSNKGGGTEYKNPNHSHECIRVMPGNPNSSYPAQQKPYYKVTKKDGQYYDKYGNQVSKDSFESHIPFN